MQVTGRLEDFEARGASLLAIAHASPEYCEGFREHMRLPFPVASVPDRRIHEDYGLERATLWTAFNPKVLWGEMLIVLRHRRDLGRTYRPPTGEDDLYALGADFVVDGGGRVLYAHVCRSPDDRPSADEMIASLDAAR